MMTDGVGEVRGDQPQRPRAVSTAAADRGGHGHAALTLERQLDRRAVVERQRGKDRVAAIFVAVVGATIPHRGNIEKGEIEHARGGGDVHAMGAAGANRTGDARAARHDPRHHGAGPEDFLEQQHERSFRLPGQGARSEIVHQRRHVAAADMDVPAHRDEPPVRRPGRRGPKHCRRSDGRAPPIRPDPFVPFGQPPPGYRLAGGGARRGRRAEDEPRVAHTRHRNGQEWQQHG